MHPDFVKHNDLSPWIHDGRFYPTRYYYKLRGICIRIPRWVWEMKFPPKNTTMNPFKWIKNKINERIASIKARQEQEYNELVTKAMSLAWSLYDRQINFRDYRDEEIPVMWRRRIFTEQEIKEITDQCRENKDILIPRIMDGGAAPIQQQTPDAPKPEDKKPNPWKGEIGHYDHEVYDHVEHFPEPQTVATAQEAIEEQIIKSIASMYRAIMTLKRDIKNPQQLKLMVTGPLCEIQHLSKDLGIDCEINIRQAKRKGRR